MSSTTAAPLVQAVVVERMPVRPPQPPQPEAGLPTVVRGAETLIDEDGEVVSSDDDDDEDDEDDVDMTEVAQELEDMRRRREARAALEGALDAHVDGQASGRRLGGSA